MLLLLGLAVFAPAAFMFIWGYYLGMTREERIAKRWDVRNWS